MKNSKETSLALAALFYAVDCVAEGDADGLRAVGLGFADAAMLCSLTVEELRRVGLLCAHGLQMRLDPDIPRVVVRRLKGTGEAEALQRSLIEADASRAMMRNLYGMGEREYGRLRRLLSVARGAGRPAELDEAAEHDLWRALDGHLTSDPERPLEPERILDVHAETGLPVRAIWACAKRWAEEGRRRNP